MKVGTAISKVATPIAAALRMDCVDPVTRQLRPGTPCAQARDALDRAVTPRDYGNALFDRFFRKTKTMETKEQEQKLQHFVIVKQIGILAESPEKAILAHIEHGAGDTISMGCSPRPAATVTQSGSAPTMQKS